MKLFGFGKSAAVPVARVIQLTMPCPLCERARKEGVKLTFQCGGCLNAGRVTPAHGRWLAAILETRGRA